MVLINGIALHLNNKHDYGPVFRLTNLMIVVIF